MSEIRYYVCDNDDCWYKGRVQEVHPEMEATCSKCGWFMNAYERPTGD